MTPEQQAVEDALTLAEHVCAGREMKAMADEVRRLRAEIAVVGQWSSVVIAGPPTENEHVLVYFEFGGLSGFSVAYWTRLRGWLQILGDRSDACYCDPTHWMSLPKEP